MGAIMTVEDLLYKLKTDPRHSNNIVNWRVLPQKPARWAAIPDNLDPYLIKALHDQGVDKLYHHQEKAVQKALAGENLVVATPTASGKTLCYNLPVFHTLIMDKAATALYLFPTKALSQDQLSGIDRLNRSLPNPVKAMTYDGDTPASARKAIRSSGDIVVTNPFMLHAGVMPNHARWAAFFKGLAYVVIDEMHTLTGVYGSHFANLMRRLHRICRHYGSKPAFIFSSATISNPAELAQNLIERPVQAVCQSGAPQGEKQFIFYNPPVVNRELGLRRSSLEEARRLAAIFAEQGIQTINFCRSRNSVEVLVKYLKDHFNRHGLDASRVCAYRGGYLPLLRRRIEKGLRDGEIDAVVATNALELGVDIGSLDVSILTGYPGSVASTMQQAGRSGRKAGLSVAILVGGSNATDQFVVNQPDYVLEQAPEAGVIDPDNLIIRVNQIKCAAFELPFVDEEEFGGSNDTAQILDYLERDARIIRRVKGVWRWMSRTFPAEHVSLNASEMDNFVVIDKDERKIIGEVDRPSAISMIHQGAIYGFQGTQYFIEELDYDKRRALAVKTESDYYTEADIETEIRIHHHNMTREYESFDLHQCEIGVTKTATLFKKIKFYTRENVGCGPIQLPPESMHTEAIFITLSENLALKAGLYEGARTTLLESVAKLFHRATPLFVRCNISDLGMVSEIRSPHFEKPAIILFDEIPGGVGLAEAAGAGFKPILKAMADIIEKCPCSGGCPGCISPSLESGDKSGPEYKRAALELVNMLFIASEKSVRYFDKDKAKATSEDRPDHRTENESREGEQDDQGHDSSGYTLN